MAKGRGEIDMLHGPLGGKLLRFALPLAAGGMVQQMFNAADTAVVGRFGDADALAAMGGGGVCASKRNFPLKKRGASFIMINGDLYAIRSVDCERVVNMKKQIKRLVVKVGTSSLTYATGNINFRKISRLVEVLSDISNSGVQVTLVSSGAIAVGVGKLGLAQRPADVPGRQAAAAVGQSELMFLYDKLFSEYSKIPAQMLLTGSDIADAERRAHLVNTFEQLIALGALPIVNENDSVSVEEIVHGDNDCLSAEVAGMIGADALVILTDIDGLYDHNPKTDPAARRISVVEEITPAIEAMAGGAGSERGTGGMATKIRAAQIATAHGVDTYVINGTPCDNLYALLEGRDIGTLFCAKEENK